MANRNDGLAEVLVQLAGNAATLIERARASAAMKAASAAQTVDGETVSRKADEAAPAEELDAQRAALQDIVVQQAMKQHLLEAEIATLKAEVTALKAERDALKDAAKAARAKPKPAKAARKAATA